MALIDRRVDYEVSRGESSRGREVDVLNLFVPGPDPSRRVRIALTVLDYDDLRGALRATRAASTQRGDLAALQRAPGGAVSRRACVTRRPVAGRRGRRRAAWRCWRERRGGDETSGPLGIDASRHPRARRWR